jgi:quinol monooxygenase YgiN
MSDRPTPETDAAIKEQSEWKLPFVSATMDSVTYDGPVASFCRRIERERDEAREELHDIRLNLGADAEGYTLLHAVCVLQQERDEAREAFKEMWRSGDAFLPHVDSETINRWRKAAGWEETK